MSARSFRRKNERAALLAQRRNTGRARRAATGAGAVIAAALFGPAAAEAATFQVNKLADGADGSCSLDDCSLREAVYAANDAAGDDLVTFAPGLAGTINLIPGVGGIEIVDEGLEIRGPGAGVLTVSGQDQSQIFKLFGFDSEGEDVLISGLTLTDGLAFDSRDRGPHGGAISSSDGGSGVEYSDFGDVADLTVSESVIKDSVAEGDGGAIAAYVLDSNGSGGVSVVNSTISGNTAAWGGGVSVVDQLGEVRVSNSTFSGNSAVDPPDEPPEEVDLREGETGAPDGEQSSGDGGAIGVDRFVFEPPTRGIAPPGVVVNNATVAGNSAEGAGGGIAVSGADVSLRSTITANNTAAQDPDLASVGAGASFTAGFSLIEAPGSTTFTSSPAGSNRTGVDPQLGPLANNGGSTPTHLPAATSPAIDAGTANATTPDQRGVARPQDQPEVANATGSDASDIGAVERALPPVEEEDTPPQVIPNVPVNDPRCLGEQFAVKRGNEGDNVIPGTAAKDGIFAGPGDDVLTGLEADDCLIGGTGRDKVEGDEGDDIVYGDPDNDKVKGGDGNDDARGQGGDDEVDGGEGDDSVRGGAGDDDLEGGAGKDFLKSNGGDDTLDPGPGEDRLRASGGADVINTADGSKDRVDCGTGKDVATVDALDFVDENCNEVRAVR